MKYLEPILFVSIPLFILAAFICLAFKIWEAPDIPEIIKCDQRYVWDSYWGEIKYKDWDYMYLEWYHSIDTICSLDKEHVEEWFPLCWTVEQFSWPLDTSNMNCYYDNPKSKLKAFKKQMEDEKKEDERYYTCDIDSSHIVELYNDCETKLCATNTLRRYFSEVCPRASVK